MSEEETMTGHGGRKGKSIDQMTPQERQQHVHDRLRHDMAALSAMIEATERSLNQSRIIWIAAIISGTIAILSVFIIAYSTGHLTLEDMWIVVIIILVFASVRYISYKIILNQEKMVHMIFRLYSKEANSATLKMLSNGIDHDHPEDAGESEHADAG